MPTPESHALLSASSSSRWLHCTRAPRLEEGFPESTSPYAEAGRVAHAMAELKARKYFVEPMSTRTYNARLKKLKEDPHYDRGMDASTDTYLDYLKELAMGFGDVQPFVALENRVDYSDYAPEGFGTADCIIIGSGRICIVDYKNGSGVPVEAEHNSQMMLYALGALKVYAPIYGDTIREVHLAIVQPNAGGIKEWSLTRAELEAWGEDVVKPAAALAFAGEGAFAPDEDPNGWCKFCRAAPVCRAHADQAARLAFQPQTPPELLSDAEVGERLTLVKQFQAYAKLLESYAEKTLLLGKPIPGFKLVEGKTSRVWTNGMDVAFEALKRAGIDEALLWKREPVTPPGLEKTLGKKTYEEVVGPLVTRVPGKPALAPESDPRKPYNAAAAAFQVVNGGG